MPDHTPAVFPEDAVSYLRGRPTPTARSRALGRLLKKLDAEQVSQLAEALKEEVVKNLWADIPAAMLSAQMILSIARRTRNESIRALGLRAKAQTLTIGMGEHRKALRFYQRALKIHRKQGD